jgi:hypothetical protein
MSIFKRGYVYWFPFLDGGKHIQRSTKQGNPRVARQIEAAYRTARACDTYLWIGEQKANTL